MDARILRSGTTQARPRLQQVHDHQSDGAQPRWGQKHPRRGLPAITGAARVGETLIADTSQISDQDEMATASFSYQWQAGGSDIDEPTGASYILTEAQEGLTMQVQVTFTDDAGNAETLTSPETEAVESAPNNPATGAPVITGTVQVEETLTPDRTRRAHPTRTGWKTPPSPTGGPPTALRSSGQPLPATPSRKTKRARPCR